MPNCYKSLPYNIIYGIFNVPVLNSILKYLFLFIINKLEVFLIKLLNKNALFFPIKCKGIIFKTQLIWQLLITDYRHTMFIVLDER